MHIMEVLSNQVSMSRLGISGVRVFIGWRHKLPTMQRQNLHGRDTWCVKVDLYASQVVNGDAGKQP
jgi:hypothetical protein